MSTRWEKIGTVVGVAGPVLILSVAALLAFTVLGREDPKCFRTTDERWVEYLVDLNGDRWETGKDGPEGAEYCVVSGLAQPFREHDGSGRTREHPGGTLDRLWEMEDPDGKTVVVRKIRGKWALDPDYAQWFRLGE